MLVVNELNKKYNDKTVVNDVCFKIPQGKVTSLIGPNGAGKSTVLNMISRLIPRASGEIIFKEQDIIAWDTNKLAKSLSILKQSNSSYLKITVKELVEFGRFPYSKGKLTKADKAYITKALEYMQLLDIKDCYLDELSGGQRQRAYIAMVIAQDTEYIMLDEPLNNVDIKHSVNMMKLLKQLCAELNKTVIIVMHDLNFAAAYSDYIIAFKNGNLIKAGNPNEVINQQVLEKIYDIPIEVKEVAGKNICIY